MTTYGNSFSERAKREIGEAQAAVSYTGHAAWVRVNDADYWALRLTARQGGYSYRWFFRHPHDWPANGREYRSVTANRAVNELAAIYETEAIRAAAK